MIHNTYVIYVQEKQQLKYVRLYYNRYNHYTTIITTNIMQHANQYITLTQNNPTISREQCNPLVNPNFHIRSDNVLTFVHAIIMENMFAKQLSAFITITLITTPQFLHATCIKLYYIYNYRSPVILSKKTQESFNLQFPFTGHTSFTDIQ